MDPNENQAEDEGLNGAYIHLTRNGDIFFISGETGEEKWISVSELKKELAQLKLKGGQLLYSREHPQEADPPEIVEALFQIIVGYELPMTFTVEIHPRAQRKSNSANQSSPKNIKLDRAQPHTQLPCPYCRASNLYRATREILIHGSWHSNIRDTRDRLDPESKFPGWKCKQCGEKIRLTQESRRKHYFFTIVPIAICFIPLIVCYRLWFGNSADIGLLLVLLAVVSYVLLTAFVLRAKGKLEPVLLSPAWSSETMNK